MLQFRSDTAHRIHLVTDGIGKLHTIYGDFEVKAGDIFFTFAAAQYSIESASDLKYMYISFLGIRRICCLNSLKLHRKTVWFQTAGN